MRREVARAAVTATCIALAVLAVPLAVAVYLLVVGDERSELERTALHAATTVDPAVTGSVTPLESEPGDQLGLYDAGGGLRAGQGPRAADQATRRALRGTVSQDSFGGRLVVAVPLVRGSTVSGAIRVASPVRVIWERTAAGWAALTLAMAVALVAAVQVARGRARRLAAPMESLAAASAAVGDGDFTVVVPDCGIEEIDRVAATQNETVRRLGELLERERQFAANASHQLRTPLAGLHLILEAARGDPGVAPGSALEETLADASVTADRLIATVEDVLALQREGSGAPAATRGQALTGILADAQARWQPRFEAAGRRVTRTCAAEVAGRRLPAVRVGQILDVLLENALLYGAGTVRCTGRPAGGATAVDVADEGTEIPGGGVDIFGRGTGSGHGIGLSLARDLAASLGGRLVLSARTPTVFTLFLPADARRR